MGLTLLTFEKPLWFDRYSWKALSNDTRDCDNVVYPQIWRQLSFPTRFRRLGVLHYANVLFRKHTQKVKHAFAVELYTVPGTYKQN